MEAMGQVCCRQERLYTGSYRSFVEPLRPTHDLALTESFARAILARIFHQGAVI